MAIEFGEIGHDDERKFVGKCNCHLGAFAVKDSGMTSYWHKIENVPILQAPGTIRAFVYDVSERSGFFA